MKIQQSKPDVFISNEPIVAVSRDIIETLKDAARQSPRKRARFCAHPGNDDPIQEMLIVLARDTYICPHKHPGKSESFHVVEGRADVVIFDEAGNITRVIRLGDYHSGRPFYYRISSACFHTVILHTDFLLIHETTRGPFRAGDCQFAPWAPKETEAGLWPEYMRKLKTTVALKGL